MLLYVFNRSLGFPLFSTFFLVEKSSQAALGPRHRPEEAGRFQTRQSLFEARAIFTPFCPV